MNEPSALESTLTLVEESPAPADPPFKSTRKLAGKSLYVAGQVSCAGSRIYVKRYEDFIKLQGSHVTEDIRKADIVLVDTCAASSFKEEESLDLIKNSQTTAKEGAKVIVCGCLAGINPQRLQENFKGEFFSPKNEKQLASILGLDEEDAKFLNPFEARGRFMGGRDFVISGHDFIGGRRLVRLLVKLCVLLHQVNNRVSLEWVPLLGRLLLCTQAGNDRAYAVSISQGCLGSCTFCVIPIAKGRTVSLPISLIVEKIQSMVEKGVKKILLSSEDTGAYGKDINATIVDLLRHIHNIPGEFTLYINYFDPRWLRFYGRELIPIIAQGRIRFLQFALQSGSNAVLNRMKRSYQIEQVLPVIREMKRLFPKLALSTQIIAGFPGETEEDFEASRAVVKEKLFDLVQVFEFTNRPQAETQDMPGHLPHEVVRARTQRLKKDWLLSKVLPSCAPAPR